MHPHQVGGHGKLMTSTSGTLYKPVQKRELFFYLEMRDKHPALLPFCAELKGLATFHGDPKSTDSDGDCAKITYTVKFLDADTHSDSLREMCDKLSPYLRENQRVYFAMQDLTRGLHIPCVMDLKTGTRIHGLDAPAEKAQRLRARMDVTTSGSLGLALSGFKCVKRTGETTVVSKMTSAQGKDLTDETMKTTIHDFFHDGVAFRPDVVSAILAQLEDFQTVISQLTPDLYRFWATSLLLIFDGDPTSDCRPVVRLVDFASTAPVQEMRDLGLDVSAAEEQDGFLFGLGNLISMIRELDSTLQ